MERVEPAPESAPTDTVWEPQSVQCQVCLDQLPAGAKRCRSCGWPAPNWQWEYQEVLLADGTVADELSNRAGEGWDVVSAIPEWKWSAWVNRELEFSYAYAHPDRLMGWRCILRRLVPVPRPKWASVEPYLLEWLPNAYKRRPRAKKGVIQFVFTGREEGKWLVRIGASGCTVRRGASSHPDVVITSDSEVWLRIFRRQIHSNRALEKSLFNTRGDDTVLRSMLQGLSLV